MKKILILHTGGTISMQEDEKTGAVQLGNIHPLREFPLAIEGVETVVQELFHLPSPHITLHEMLKIKNSIESAVKEEKIDGVVITHGTDTLEETAYFLDLTINLPIPIIVTGAMRSSNELGSDGLYNVLSAIKVATSDLAKELGVLVVMNDEIHTAKNVTKTHTSNVATFQSPQYGPIGIVNKSYVAFHHKPLKREHFSVHSITKQVLLFKAYAGMDGKMLEAAENINPDGIVIEALGQGNLPPALIPCIKSFISKNVPIVIVSRCFNGTVQDVYDYKGGGKHLKEIGAIFSNGLNGQKARIKLLICLEKTTEMQKIAKMFGN